LFLYEKVSSSTISYKRLVGYIKIFALGFFLKERAFLSEREREIGKSENTTKIYKIRLLLVYSINNR